MNRSTGDSVDANLDPDALSAEVRELAAYGLLLTGEVPISRIRQGVYLLAFPVVYTQLTRRLERGRGHHQCTMGVQWLAPECIDQFHDDVEAVVADVLRHGDQPIQNLEGWIASRLNAVTVDAHRRARGERGAMQRPRLPGWLCKGLGDDPVLTSLAVDVLTWVGVRTASPNGPWPLEVWADRRAVKTGDSATSMSSVRTDLEVVLRAMRARPDWYEKYVETPLGRKEVPVTSGAFAPLVTENNDRLRELAASVIDAVVERVRSGEPAGAAVVEATTEIFGRVDGPAPDPEVEQAGDRVAALMTDSETIRRTVEVIEAILADACSDP